MIDRRADIFRRAQSQAHHCLLSMLLFLALLSSCALVIAACPSPPISPGDGLPASGAALTLFQDAYARNGGAAVGCAINRVHELGADYLLQDFTNDNSVYKHRSIIILKKGASAAYLLHGSVLDAYWMNNWENLTSWGAPVCDVLDVLGDLQGDNTRSRIAEWGSFANDVDVYFRYGANGVILVEEPIRTYYRAASGHLGPAGLPMAGAESADDCIRQRFQYQTIACGGRFETQGLSESARLALAVSAAEYLLTCQYTGSGTGHGLFNNVFPRDPSGEGHPTKGFTYIVPREHGIVITALAELHRRTGDERYRRAALDAATALMTLQISAPSGPLDGGFYKQYRLGSAPSDSGDVIDPPDCSGYPCAERLVSPGYVSQVLIGFAALGIEHLPEYSQRVWLFTRKAADFLVRLVKTVGDPKEPLGGIYGGYLASAFGVHTLNANLFPNDHASAARALDYAAHVAGLNRDSGSAQRYEAAAAGIRKVLDLDLFDAQHGHWHLHLGDDGTPYDPTPRPADPSPDQPGLDAWIALYWQEGEEHAAEVLDWMKRELRHPAGAIGMTTERSTSQPCSGKGNFYCAVAGHTVTANKLFELYGTKADADLGRAWFEQRSGLLCPPSHDCSSGTHAEWIDLDPQAPNLYDPQSQPRVAASWERFIDGQAYWILDVLGHRFSSRGRDQFLLLRLPSRGGWRATLQ